MIQRVTPRLGAIFVRRLIPTDLLEPLSTAGMDATRH
jgi:hypothetical protein